MRIYISTYATGCSKKCCLFKQAIQDTAGLHKPTLRQLFIFIAAPCCGGQVPPSNCDTINQAAVLITHSASCETQSAAARNLNPIDLNNSSPAF